MYYFDKRENVEKLAKALEEWHGTPWMFNARQKKVGVDCSNYVAGVLEDCGARDKIVVPPHPNWYFIQKEDNRLLDGILNLGVEKTSVPQDGDLVLYQVGRSIAHVSIFYENKIYHALYRIGTHIVSWKNRNWKRRMKYIFRLRDES